MDISTIGNLSSALLQGQQTGDAVGIQVLKKAQQIEAQTATQLIESIQPPSTNNPPNLGKNVDVKA